MKPLNKIEMFGKYRFAFFEKKHWPCSNSPFAVRCIFRVVYNLVVSTHFKNISEIGSSSPIFGVNIKNICVTTTKITVWKFIQTKIPPPKKKRREMGALSDPVCQWQMKGLFPSLVVAILSGLSSIFAKIL